MLHAARPAVRSFFELPLLIIFGALVSCPLTKISSIFFFFFFFFLALKTAAKRARDRSALARAFFSTILMAIPKMRAHICSYLKNTCLLASSAQNSAVLSGSPRSACS